MTFLRADEGPGGAPLEQGPLLPVPETIGPADRRALQAKVASLLRRAREAFPHWSPPPFDPRVLARGLGIPIHYTSRGLGGPDALIVHKQGRFHILADARVRNAGRLNFTLAHEIAHTFFERAEEQVHLRTEDRAVYDRSPEGRSLERCCDLAAAELLMPGSSFDPAAEASGFHARTVGRLASRFEVSLQAAAIRLVRWRAHRPVAVGFFEYGLPPATGRPHDPTAYRVRRLFRSDSFPFLFPEGKSVPRDSVIYLCSLLPRPRMLSARECFRLGSATRLLAVSALPLPRRGAEGEPPSVCAAFEAESWERARPLL